jgi:hypothetical protein
LRGVSKAKIYEFAGIFPLRRDSQSGPWKKRGKYTLDWILDIITKSNIYQLNYDIINTQKIKNWKYKTHTNKIYRCRELMTKKISNTEQIWDVKGQLDNKLAVFTVINGPDNTCNLLWDPYFFFTSSI